MTFLKSTLLVGVVLAFPLLSHLDARGPGSDVTADQPAANLVRAPLALPSQDDVYARHCAPCHGKKGRGDGVAASAFNPPPADFTDRELMSERTDEQLLNAIKDGKAAMPAFGSVLTAEELDEVLIYIRSLIPDEEGAGG